MSPRTAWALAELGEGRRAPWLRHDEAHRLRARHDVLARDPAPELLLRSWVASRAERHELHSTAPDGLLGDPRLTLSGVSDPRSGMSARHQVEAYVHADDLDAVCVEHLLVPANPSDANVWLHAAPLLPGRPVPLLLVAADLAEHDGPRELGRARDLIVRVMAEDPRPWAAAAGAADGLARVRLALQPRTAPTRAATGAPTAWGPSRARGGTPVGRRHATTRGDHPEAQP
ncbi:hypothetical protein [Cellulomonas sp. SLBN-39]|uniref:hypothetical protein n=1 Tax=Cellulomonas sp. SLBN-39 TaxID=2768446 RepID=UPI001154371B|nr:hypothetical protein [Cellulomonas sp. SLBN-39]